MRAFLNHVIYVHELQSVFDGSPIMPKIRAIFGIKNNRTVYFVCIKLDSPKHTVPKILFLLIQNKRLMNETCIILVSYTVWFSIIKHTTVVFYYEQLLTYCTLTNVMKRLRSLYTWHLNNINIRDLQSSLCAFHNRDFREQTHICDVYHREQAHRLLKREFWDLTCSWSPRRWKRLFTRR